MAIRVKSSKSDVDPLSRGAQEEDKTAYSRASVCHYQSGEGAGDQLQPQAPLHWWTRRDESCFLSFCKQPSQHGHTRQVRLLHYNVLTLSHIVEVIV